MVPLEFVVAIDSSFGAYPLRLHTVGHNLPFCLHPSAVVGASTLTAFFVATVKQSVTK